VPPCSKGVKIIQTHKWLFRRRQDSIFPSLKCDHSYSIIVVHMSYALNPGRWLQDRILCAERLKKKFLLRFELWPTPADASIFIFHTFTHKIIDIHRLLSYWRFGSHFSFVRGMVLLQDYAKVRIGCMEVPTTLLQMHYYVAGAVKVYNGK